MNKITYKELETITTGKIHEFGSTIPGTKRICFDTEESLQLDWSDIIEFNSINYICFNKSSTDETTMSDSYDPTKNYINHIFIEKQEISNE